MNVTPARQHRFGRPSALAGALGLTAFALAVGFAGGRTTVSASSQHPAPAPGVVRAAGAVPQVGAVSYSAVVDKVAPAVVTVRVEKQAEATLTVLPEPFREFFGPQRGMPQRERGLGSGVVIREDGDIVTNYHVVAGADRVRVDLADGRSFPAKVVGSDEASDLAVLRIEARGLPTVPFGDSDRVKVGDVVLAFGNPLGVGQTVTMGIVSAKGRATGVGDGTYEDFLQTDAPINQGNSGGALINMQGELVGINAQILSPSGGNVGLGFAIPSVMARSVTDQLAHDGVVHRSKLGVTVQAMTPELAASLGLPDTRGALVSAVEPGSPAERAGLRQEDVITGLDGQSVMDANTLRNHIAAARPNTSVSIDVLRNGKRESVSVRLVERERPSTPPRPAGDADRGEAGFGMTLAVLTPRVAEQLDLRRTDTGLVVTDVDPAGLAASVGIQAGDVITHVNGRDVKSVPELRAAMDTQTGRPALVLVNRHGADLFVALPRAS